MDNAGAEYQLGNWFHVVDWQNTLHAVDVALSERSGPGAIVVAVVYDEDLNCIIESEKRGAGRRTERPRGGHFITLPLSIQWSWSRTMTISSPCTTMVAAVPGRVSAGSSQPQTSLFWDANDNTWYLRDGDPPWYTHEPGPHRGDSMTATFTATGRSWHHRNDL